MKLLEIISLDLDKRESSGTRLGALDTMRDSPKPGSGELEFVNKKGKLELYYDDRLGSYLAYSKTPGGKYKKVGMVGTSDYRNGVAVHAVGSANEFSGFDVMLEVYKMIAKSKPLISDIMQTRGGTRLWVRLLQDPAISVYAFDERKPREMHDLEVRDGKLYSDTINVYKDTVRLVAKG